MVQVEHVAAALGQTGPAATRRYYLAAGTAQDGKPRAPLRVISQQSEQHCELRHDHEEV